jgi:polyhydroxyalkanoate synthesis regulator phasin
VNSLPKKIVSFSLSDESIKEIGKASKALGMSRSELIDFLAKDGFQFTEEVKNVLDEIADLQKDAKKKMNSKVDFTK